MEKETPHTLGPYKIIIGNKDFTLFVLQYQFFINRSISGDVSPDIFMK